MISRRFFVVVACVAGLASGQAIATVVDLATPAGTLRVLDLRPGVASATILVLPGPGQAFGILGDGTMAGPAAACDPIARNRDFLVARGLAIAFADQAYPNAAAIVAWLRSRGDATVWVAGTGAAAPAVANLVVATPPATPLGAVFLSPHAVAPSLAGAIARPALVIYHLQDASALGPALLADLTSATDKSGVALSGGVAGACGYGSFEALDVAFVNALAGFVNLHGVPSYATTPAVEYFNAGFGHYFMTADTDEIGGLDAGAFGGAFARTGRSFKAVGGPAAGTVPVCRFFTTPGTFGAKSSHFYTANPVECEGLKLNPDWIYEKIAFHVAVPAGGVCGAGTVPVYRMYNHGQTGAPNHRFTTDLALYQQFTTTLGWDPEGIAFCAPV